MLFVVLVEVQFSLCNINANEKNCNLKENKIVAMQMHLSIEEQGKRKLAAKQRRISLASSKVKVILPFCFLLSLWLILLVLF
jgi:hypothetical protein